MIIWPAKGPDETEDFGFDFSPVLQSGENIASHTLTGSGVTVGSDDVTDGRVSLMLSGGTAGTIATVVCTIVTDSTPPRTYSEVAALEIGEEVISLADIKSYVRLETDDEDLLLAALLAGAVSMIERSTGKCMTQRLVTQTLDGFPGSAPYSAYPGCGRYTEGQAIRLSSGPLSSSPSPVITYDDGDGAEQTAAGYRIVDGGKTARTRLLPAYGQLWPPTAIGPGTVRITYAAGYAPGARPRELEQAIRMLVAHWYLNREAVSSERGAAAVELPLGVREIVEPYRIPGIA